MTDHSEQTTPDRPLQSPRAIGFIVLLAAVIVLATAGIAAAASSNSQSDETAVNSSSFAAGSQGEDCGYTITLASGESAQDVAASLSGNADAVIDHNGVEITVADESGRTRVGAMFAATTYVTVEASEDHRAALIDALKKVIDEDDDWWFEDDIDLSAEFSGQECDASRFDHHDFSKEDLANTNATLDLDTGDGKCQLKSHIGKNGFDWKDFDFRDLSLDIDDENDTFTISLDSDQAQISFGCSDS